jgi:hypothetical protein
MTFPYLLEYLVFTFNYLQHNTTVYLLVVSLSFLLTVLAHRRCMCVAVISLYTKRVRYALAFYFQ